MSFPENPVEAEGQGQQRAIHKYGRKKDEHELTSCSPFLYQWNAWVVKVINALGPYPMTAKIPHSISSSQKVDFL